MNRIHNIWAVLCFLMSCLFFVLGRWSVFSEMDQQAPPVPVAQGQQSNRQSCEDRSVTLGGSQANGGYRGKEKSLSSPPPSPQQVSAETSPVADSALSPSLADVPTMTDGRAANIPQQSPEVAAMLEKDIESLQEEVAHSLRNQGVPEEEITAQLQASLPSLSTGEARVPEEPAPPSPEQMTEDYAAALHESGVPDEELELMMDSFVSSLAPQETGEP